MCSMKMDPALREAHAERIKVAQKVIGYSWECVWDK
jgi:hypothetical protein